ncbi:MAG: hypothetical protein AAFW73_18265 [Bacteroidota bacterium]
MKTSIQYACGLALLLFLGWGCQHDTDTFDGPFLVDRFGEFAVVTNLEVSQPTVDFTAGETVFFTAAFNKNVDWIVEITGTESGAVRRIEGFDREVAAGNATWTGGTTDLPFFSAENCSVKLLVPEEPDFVDSVMVEVLTPKVYEGSLFTNFEEDLGVNAEIGNFEFEFTNNTTRSNTAVPPAEGEFVFYLEGTDDVVPNFFVGLVAIESDVAGATYAPLPTKVPEELYFNCFIHGDGGPHTIAIVEFVVDSNDSGNYEDGPDALFRVPDDLRVTWEGWNHINYPMSETGITEEDLEKLVAIRLVLISDRNAQPDPPLTVDFGIDFITFTQGAPLQL